jgi:putative ABC transport system permease protein
MHLPVSTLVLAARNTVRHKTRSLIALASIAFGVVALLLAGGFIEWTFWALRESTIQTGLGHIQVTRPGFHQAGRADPGRYLLPAEGPELDVVRQAPSVRILDQRLVIAGLASSGDTTVGFTGEADTPDAGPRISSILPVTGSNLSPDDAAGVLLGRGLAAALGVQPGDTVSFIVNLPNGGINAVDGRVRGTFATGVRAYDDNAVRMPLELGRRLTRVRGSHLWVIGLGDTDADPAQTVQALRRALPEQRFQVATWDELSDFYGKAVTLLSRQIDVLAVLMGLVIVLSITNTLTMNVLERTGEIGTLRALGNSRWRVLGLFVLEGVLLGLAGAIIGLVVGYIAAKALSYVGIPMPPPPGRDDGYTARILLDPMQAVRALAVATVSTALASLYPAWTAARLPIVDALRHNR